MTDFKQNQSPKLVRPMLHASPTPLNPTYNQLRIIVLWLTLVSVRPARLSELVGNGKLTKGELEGVGALHPC